MPDNSLAKYLSKEYKGVIQSVQVYNGTSKEGSPYYAIDIVLCNGYKSRMFLKSAEQFAWTNAFDMIETQKQIDNNF